MSKELTVKNQNQVAEFNDEQVEILRKTLFKKFSDDEIKFSLAVCNRTGLDPFVRQIYFQKRKNHKTGDETIVITTGIDGFRLIANRSTAYAGSDEPVFEERDGKPIKATVTVYRIVQGQRCGFTASVRWNEFYPGDGPDGMMWRKMPFGQLSKCAEAQALRKAFPAELSNVYADEEMAQAANDRTVIQTKANQVNELLNLSETPDLEVEAVIAEEPDFLTEAASVPPQSVGDFVITFGKKFKNRRLKEISIPELESYVTWLTEQNSSHASVVEAIEKINRYLEAC
jgi:phage recombination protein Bet